MLHRKVNYENILLAIKGVRTVKKLKPLQLNKGAGRKRMKTEDTTKLRRLSRTIKRLVVL